MQEQSYYQKIREEIAAAAIDSGRDPSSISLIAVTKQVDWQTAFQLYDQGQRDFAENRYEEAMRKKEEAPKDCRWHFIGRLQKNKVRRVIGEFDLIHSVDSCDLAEKISAVSLEKGIVTAILLQANTSGETSKSGLNPEAWKECFESILALKGVSVLGLMTMAPLTDNEGQIRQCFSKLRKLRDELQWVAGRRADLRELSMGMSHDFKIAIQEVLQWSELVQLFLRSLGLFLCSIKPEVVG
nr:Pyridoxal phosphate homeostasis protein [uncultured bacterium]